MAQHDYVIANGTGAAVRSDLNNALAAIVSQNSGATEPATTYAYQFWADTTTGTLKLRNSANSAWIELLQLDGTLTMEDGTEALPGLSFRNDLDTGLWRPGTNQLAISTNAVERVEFGASEVVFNDGGANYDFRVEGDTNANLLFVDASADAVGIGTSDPQRPLDVVSNSSAETVTFRGASANNISTLRFNSNNAATNYASIQSRPAYFELSTAASIPLVLSPGSGTGVGIGITAPTFPLHIQQSAGGNIVNFTNGVDADFQVNCTSGVTTAGPTSGQLALRSNSVERARLDNSGRLLVGTSSNAGNSIFVVQGGTNSTSAGLIDISCGSASPASGTAIGYVRFKDTGSGSSNYQYAYIGCEVDGTSSSATDLPGRLVFSTTADGASSPTERMRISSAGNMFIGRTADNDGQGISLFGDGFVRINRSSAVPLVVNRNGDDGTLVELRQADIVEGTISVSGTTVSYNGAHLSRWSQLPSGAERTEILRGSVLSNIDEMCEWTDEENEQLNRMKVSDVEGDKNVSGVFQAWDDDDDTYTNDFYCAMTGDFIIRIGAGVTVKRGDLLMSAGDGTAKPQDDDIIRSKTIAKVTSTNVSCTYDDGSYCVPCVLMAC